MTDVVGRVIIITDDAYRRGGILYALLIILFGVLYVLWSCRPEQIVCVQDVQWQQLHYTDAAGHSAPMTKRDEPNRGATRCLWAVKLYKARLQRK